MGIQRSIYPGLVLGTDGVLWTSGVLGFLGQGGAMDSMREVWVGPNTRRPEQKKEIHSRLVSAHPNSTVRCRGSGKPLPH